MDYQITKNCTSTKDFAVNESEEKFFAAFAAVLSEQENGCIHLVRMSDGTLSVYYKTFPVGKVKLQGRTHRMQILKARSSKDVDGNVDDFIANIPEWVKYMKKL